MIAVEKRTPRPGGGDYRQVCWRDAAGRRALTVDTYEDGRFFIAWDGEFWNGSNEGSFLVPPWVIRSFWAGEDPLPILDYLLETNPDLDWLHAAVRRITEAP